MYMIGQNFQKSSKQAAWCTIIQRLGSNYVRITHKNSAVEDFKDKPVETTYFWQRYLELEQFLPLSLYLLCLHVRLGCLKFLRPPLVHCLYICTHLSWGKISTSWQNWRKHVKMLPEREPSFLQLFLDASQNLSFLAFTLDTISPWSRRDILATGRF